MDVTLKPIILRCRVSTALGASKVFKINANVDFIRIFATSRYEDPLLSPTMYTCGFVNIKDTVQAYDDQEYLFEFRKEIGKLFSVERSLAGEYIEKITVGQYDADTMDGIDFHIELYMTQKKQRRF